MVLGTVLGWNNAATISLATGLAFTFGYGLTFFPLIAQLGVGKAFKTALAADTVSIGVMELVDNAVIIVLPGALQATLADVLFWLSLVLSLVVAFVVTVPVNYWMIGRGKGHAVHDHMHHH